MCWNQRIRLWALKYSRLCMQRTAAVSSSSAGVQAMCWQDRNETSKYLNFGLTKVNSCMYPSGCCWESVLLNLPSGARRPTPAGEGGAMTMFKILRLASQESLHHICFCSSQYILAVSHRIWHLSILKITISTHACSSLHVHIIYFTFHLCSEVRFTLWICFRCHN